MEMHEIYDMNESGTSVRRKGNVWTRASCEPV